MNEKRTGLRLKQTEHIHGHLGHSYSVMVTQGMVATVRYSKWWLQLNH